MKISGNTEVGSKKYTIDKVKDSDVNAVAEKKNKSVERTVEKEEISVALHRNDKNPAVRSEEELAEIIKDISNKPFIAEDAEAMIRKANENILNNSNDAVLAQANSTSERVAELLN
ncbi:MAG: hypothetical protein U0L56_12475 [Lachnospiraceae bacterium]|nr:hypothetical protein [Lachnospiraceae bacterium]